MKKITIKLMALVMSGMAMAYASDDISDDARGKKPTKFLSLPPCILGDCIPSFLSLKDIDCLAKTSSHIRKSIAEGEAISIYAKSITANRRVPKNIMTIILSARNLDREYVTCTITAHLGEFISLSKPLPPFLNSSFYTFTLEDKHFALNELKLHRSVMDYIIGRFISIGCSPDDKYENVEKKAINSIIAYSSQYRALADAIGLEDSLPVTETIIATDSEIRNPANENSINAFFLNNPNAKLLLDMGDAKHLDKFKLPSNVRHLIISGRSLTSIGDEFLAHCNGLTTLDLSGLLNLTSIGHSFLSGCTGLTKLDLSPLSNVTSIGGCFLDNCSGLTALDLSPLSNLTSIKGCFLAGCAGLTELDLSGLSNVSSIDQFFLGYCRGLKRLDLLPLSKVTSIMMGFLAHCNNLEEIIVKGNSNIEENLSSFPKMPLRVIDATNNESPKTDQQVRKEKNIKALSTTTHLYNLTEDEIRFQKIRLPSGTLIVRKYESIANCNMFQVRREITILDRAFNDAIVKMYYATRQGLTATIATEFAEYGSLERVLDIFSEVEKSRINSGEILEDQEINKIRNKFFFGIASQVLNGLVVLHCQLNTTKGDFSPDHILFSRNGNVCLSNFSKAGQKKEEDMIKVSQLLVGTLEKIYSNDKTKMPEYVMNLAQNVKNLTADEALMSVCQDPDDKTFYYDHSVTTSSYDTFKHQYFTASCSTYAEEMRMIYDTIKNMRWDRPIYRDLTREVMALRFSKAREAVLSGLFGIPLLNTSN